MERARRQIDQLGLLNIAGGKWTTYRNMAEDCVNHAAAANRAESTGRSYPLGATIFPDGVNFSVFSRGASGVELLPGTA